MTLMKCDSCKYGYISLADYPCVRCEYRKGRDKEVEVIKCDFCKKDVEFKIEDSKISGRASMITCPNCMRRIIVGFGSEKYYEEIQK